MLNALDLALMVDVLSLSLDGSGDESRYTDEEREATLRKLEKILSEIQITPPANLPRADKP